MPPFFSIFLHREGLTINENTVYRNFNLLLGIALFDLAIISFSLKDIEPGWPFQVCMAEFAGYILLMIVHLRGYMLFARYATFLVTLLVQVIACLTHGKTSGFDYIFYALGLLPMLFFERPVYYASLFVISIVTMLGVQYAYTMTEPIIIIEGDFIFYWNLFFTGTLIFLVMYIFKSGYERTQKRLLDQNNMISHQKEEIEGINNNLEQIIVDRTKKIKDQEKRITKFAFINAHKVRSPLARIMGLLNLIDLEKNKSGTLEDYLPVLKSNAEELNEMLKEVSDTLNDINVDKTKT